MQSMKVVTVSEMREIERIADINGCSYTAMLENAGTNLGKWVHRHFSNLKNHLVIGLVGSGNNGGDTLVALDYLAKNGWISIAYLVKARSKDDVYIKLLRKDGGEIIEFDSDPKYLLLLGLLNHNAVLLDGILGTGFKSPMDSLSAKQMESILEIIEAKRNNLIIIAVDTPSGIDCTLGTVSEYVIKAEFTACMEAVKLGLLRFPASNYIGEIVRIDIGLPPNNEILEEIALELIDPEFVICNLPNRPIDSHKGSFGRSLIYAGSESYVGATYLCAKAAYYAGVGLVHVFTDNVVYDALSGNLVEAIWTINDKCDQTMLEGYISNATSILIGPGIGQTEKSFNFVGGLLNTIREIKPSIPVIIDADGLKHLQSIKNWIELYSSLQMILTPHPGEMAILTGKSVSEIQADRISTAIHYAKEWHQVVCLKGANTVIAFPNGWASIINAATSALATAGTGDVLAGLICGFCAQGCKPGIAAEITAYIHAAAGKLSINKKGQNASIIASDVLETIPSIIAELKTGNKN